MTESKVKLTKVKLKKQHTHNRKEYAKGESIFIHPNQVDWLKSLDVI